MSKQDLIIPQRDSVPSTLKHRSIIYVNGLLYAGNSDNIPEIVQKTALDGKADVEMLDGKADVDEEGTYDPEYSTTGNPIEEIIYDVQDGYYYKRGNKVDVFVRIRTNKVTLGSASGSLLMTLPFSVSSKIKRTPMSLGRVLNFSTHPVRAEHTGGSSVIFMPQNADGSVETFVSVSALSEGENSNHNVLFMHGVIIV